MLESVSGADYCLMRAEAELNCKLASGKAVRLRLGRLSLPPLFVGDEQLGCFHPRCGDTVRTSPLLWRPKHDARA